MNPTHHLWPLLAPRSVALVGASSRPGSLGRIVCENLLAGGLNGQLYLVNPRHNSVLGRKAYRSLRSIDRPVDLAVICAPPRAVATIIGECRGRVRAVVVVSGAAGALPDSYLRWRRTLAARARSAGVRMLGPASFGIMRPSLGLDATFSAVPALPGGLALISQSGAIASALVDFARAAGVGFSSVVALGAAGDVDFGEVLEFALSDIETDGIVLYVESVRDARAFLSALRAAARTKPVVVLKSGRALAAPSATSSRPAIDPDRVFDAVLRRAGTVRVQTYTQLFAAALMLGAGRQFARGSRGNRLAIVTNGRGPGVMAADRAADTGVALATLSPESIGALAAWMPSKCAPGGLVDLENEATPAQFATALQTLVADRGVDAVLVLHASVPAAPATDTARAVAAAARGADKPVLAAWLGAVDRPEAHAALEAGGIIHFHTPENAVEAFSFLAAYRRNQEWLLQVPPPQPDPLLPNLAAAMRVRERALSAGRTVLSLGETQVLLAAFGITMPMALVTDADGARSAARQLGFPVALGFDIDGHAVAGRENIRTAAALSSAFAELRRARGRPLRGEHLVVRKKLVPAEGDATPVRVAVQTDAVFGPVIAFGSARVAPSESSLMLPPLNRTLAIELIAGGHAEAGDAGQHHADEPLIELLQNVSALVCALPWVVGLELAPVVTLRGKAMVVAASATIDASRSATSTGYRHMAIHPYPSELESDLELADGTVLRTRAIRPEDATLEQEFIAALSEHSRYMRFMQHLPALTPQMLARFTQVDYDRELALLALDDASGTDHIVAVARYVANPDGESVEFAIVVADAWQHRGVGHALLERLIASAGARGYARMMGNVLTQNSPMLGFMRGMGFTVRRDPHDSDQMLVTLELASARRRAARRGARRGTVARPASR